MKTVALEVEMIALDQGVYTLSQQFPTHILSFLHKNELSTAYYFSVWGVICEQFYVVKIIFR